jgi:hypothetical protein
MNSKHIKKNEQWQVLHMQLQDLLAGYADDMLDEQNKKLVEAHLAGCEACQMDVSRQQLLSDRLNDLPVIRMSTKLHKQLDQVLKEVPVPEKKEVSQTKRWQHWLSFNCLRELKRPSFATASGWSVALMLFVVMLFPHLKQGNGNNIPMVRDVIAEYQQLSQTTLPVSLQNSSEEPPATWSGSRVLSHWKTTIGGEPADAYAVRNGDDIIFQFKVAESVFFYNPDVRLAIANTGIYQVKDDKLKILALPLKKSGLLIVGSNSGVPTPEKLTLKLI